MGSSFRLAVAAGFACVLAACGGGTVSCGPCFGPLYVNLIAPDGSWLKDTSSRQAHVCITGYPCQDHPFRGSSLSLDLPPGSTSATFDGLTVTVELSPAIPGVPSRGSATLHHSPGGGVCSCPYTAAQVTMDGS